MEQPQETLVPGSGLAEVIHDLLEGEGNGAAMQSETLTDDAGNYRVTGVTDVSSDNKTSWFEVSVGDRRFEVTVVDTTP